MSLRDSQRPEGSWCRTPPFGGGSTVIVSWTWCRTPRRGVRQSSSFGRDVSHPPSGCSKQSSARSAVMLRCSTVIDILFHVAAPRQHETKCRDVERPEGAFDSHRPLVVMFRASRRGERNNHRFLDVMFRAPLRRVRNSHRREAPWRSEACRFAPWCYAALRAA
jgi:hypothetical protein